MSSSQPTSTYHDSLCTEPRRGHTPKDFMIWVVLTCARFGSPSSAARSILALRADVFLRFSSEFPGRRVHPRRSSARAAVNQTLRILKITAVFLYCGHVQSDHARAAGSFRGTLLLLAFPDFCNSAQPHVPMSMTHTSLILA